jgi:hypothetical protein
MHMDVEIDGAAEALQDRHAAATGIRAAVRPGPRSQMALDCPVQEARHAPTQVMTPAGTATDAGV